MLKRSILAIALTMGLMPGLALAEGEAAPTVDKVMADLAAVGPDALLARVKELQGQVDNLNAQAAAKRKEADQLVAQGEALKKQIAAVEKFTAELAKAMAPPPPPEPTPAAPAAAPAEPAPATPPPAEPAPEQPKE